MYNFHVLLFINFIYGISSDTRSEEQCKKDMKFTFNKIRDKYLLEDPRVENVLRKYDRSKFLPFSSPDNIYKDKYIYLGCGAEFSSPFTHAEALHLLRNHLKPGANILEIGSGTGYLATCMAEMVQPNGSVIGLDLVSTLVDYSIKCSMQNAAHLIDSNLLKFFVADGRYGYQNYGPFDVIYTDCSHRTIPSVLIQQLKPGGRFIMTLGRTELPQYLIVVDKDMEGKTEFARIRIRNKVPRLCTNIKEQDLYFQRMYPLKHAQYLPTLSNGEFMTTVNNRHKKLQSISLQMTRFNSEDLAHFADAERRYEEKIGMIQQDYNDEDQLFIRHFTKKSTKLPPKTFTPDPLLNVDYEVWSAG